MAERWTVAPVVGGSIPLTHPLFRQSRKSVPSMSEGPQILRLRIVQAERGR